MAFTSASLKQSAVATVANTPGQSTSLRGIPPLSLPPARHPFRRKSQSLGRSPSNCAAVHPRVCGERASSVTPEFCPTGSSPRVRGTRWWRRACRWYRRFIPACAGNTPPSRPTAPSPPVYPRVCGEHSEGPFNTMAETGLSPRVRGTLISPCVFRQRPRFIPACAGNAMLISL